MSGLFTSPLICVGITGFIENETINYIVGVLLFLVFVEIIVSMIYFSNAPDKIGVIPLTKTKYIVNKHGKYYYTTALRLMFNKYITEVPITQISKNCYHIPLDEVDPKVAKDLVKVLQKNLKKEALRNE